MRIKNIIEYNWLIIYILDLNIRRIPTFDGAGLSSNCAFGIRQILILTIRKYNWQNITWFTILGLIVYFDVCRLSTFIICSGYAWYDIDGVIWDEFICWDAWDSNVLWLTFPGIHIYFIYLCWLEIGDIENIFEIWNLNCDNFRACDIDRDWDCWLIGVYQCALILCITIIKAANR